MYRASDGQLVWKVEIPEGGIYTVDMRPDGQTVAAGGFDGTVRLFDAESGKLVRALVPVEIASQPVAAR
jgi:WD40 repeat protein